MQPRTLVIGAGPAGLAAAAALARAGADAEVLERGPTVGSSWADRYDHLRLHTARRWSGLPGYPIPRRYGRWVSRDGVVAYLHEYARHHGLAVRCSTTAQRVDRADGRWQVTTDRGVAEATSVVVATGYNRDPAIPPWPGRERFRGRLLHSSAYRNPAPLRGCDVLVVGSGNSGAEIAAAVAGGGARRVRLAVRTPPHVFPRSSFGLPSQAISIVAHRLPPRLVDPLVQRTQRLLVGDLRRYGLPAPPWGPYEQFQRTDVVPILDVGLVDALRRGRVGVVAAVERLEADAVVLADGRRVTPDVVIAATGYRRGLEPLVGHLGVVRADGRPTVHAGQAAAAMPGLHFIGFTNPISGALREFGAEAAEIARVLRPGRGRRLLPTPRPPARRPPPRAARPGRG